MIQAVSRRNVNVEALVRSLASGCGWKVALGQGFLWVLFLISVIPLRLHTPIHRHVDLPEGKVAEAWKPSKKTMLLQKLGALHGEIISHFSYFRVKWPPHEIFPLLYTCSTEFQLYSGHMEFHSEVNDRATLKFCMKGKYFRSLEMRRSGRLYSIQGHTNSET
jgi:hypothetical protein